MKIDRLDILSWMKQDIHRSVLIASIHFDCSPQDIYDILNTKETNDK